MSLAYAPYNEDSLEDLKTTGLGNAIEQKKQLRYNKTIKKKMADNVQNMLKTINNYDTLNNYEALEAEELLDFNPPPKAEISTKKDVLNSNNGADSNNETERKADNDEAPQKADLMMQPTIKEPQLSQMQIEKPYAYYAPQSLTDANNSIYANNSMYAHNSMNSNNSMYAHNSMNANSSMYANNSMYNTGNSKDVLLEKLNYMIHLLEEQHDEKTGHVWEEIILYSFLGVFIIFIVDSFARVGKYER